jgi:ergothioneine biosynthesis protein EgtB
MENLAPNLDEQQQPVELNVSSVIEKFQKVRGVSESLCEPLIIEDYGLQAMAETSPAKWHLAHTTWFFETFLLKPKLQSYKPLNTQYEYLFNSYYNGIGSQYPRPQRGLLSRPSVEEVYAYRHHVNNAMLDLLSDKILCTEDVINKVILGCNHEQQHQELFFTDLKYSWFQNPLYPVYAQRTEENVINKNIQGLQSNSKDNWLEIKSDLYEVGFNENIISSSLQRFCFDNEQPRHQQFLQDVSIAKYLVTNAEYLQFMQDDGYNRSELWLSDAWAALQNSTSKHAPLYWVKQDKLWYEYTLQGLQPLDLDQPVSHISAYEADAYARWKECRLPTEFEWEVFAAQYNDGAGQFLESELFHPDIEKAAAPVSMGKLWQWTSSAYSPYPGYKPAAGAIGEYNGKFMSNQLVLKGGSCVTSKDHYRHSYRNFFYPPDQWQFTGLRLAK